MKRFWPIALLLTLPVLLMGVVSAWLYQAEKERIENDYFKEAQDWSQKVIRVLTDSEEFTNSPSSPLSLLPGLESDVATHLSSGPLLTPHPKLEAAYHAALHLAEADALTALQSLSKEKQLASASTSSGLPLSLLVRYQLATHLPLGPEKEQAEATAKDALFKYPSEINELLAHKLALTPQEQALAQFQVSYFAELKPPFPSRDQIEVREHPNHFVLLMNEVVAIISKNDLRETIQKRIHFFGQPPAWLDPSWPKQSITWRGYHLDLTLQFPTTHNTISSPVQLATQTQAPLTFTVYGNRLAIQEDIAHRLQRLKLTLITTTVLTALAALFIFLTLRKQQQLAALQSDFVASVSHELRTPITSIRLLSERLQKETLPPEKSDQYHRLISNESVRLGNLVENILDFSRIEKGRKLYHFEPTDLAALLTETLALIQPNLEQKKHTLTTDIDLPAKFSPNLDPLALRQLLLNLLDNALKFTPAPGAITLTALTTPDTLKLIVTDTGPGIPASDRAKVFQRFYRRDRNTEVTGTGIGLSLVHHIVQAHGGMITISDNPDHKTGTRLTIDFPLEAKAPDFQ